MGKFLKTYPERLKDQFGMAESQEYIFWLEMLIPIWGPGNYNAQRNYTLVDIQMWVQS